jgi:hypothetical protein
MLTITEYYNSPEAYAKGYRNVIEAEGIEALTTAIRFAREAIDNAITGPTNRFGYGEASFYAVNVTTRDPKVLIPEGVKIISADAETIIFAYYESEFDRSSPYYEGKLGAERYEADAKTLEIRKDYANVSGRFLVPLSFADRVADRVLEGEIVSYEKLPLTVTLPEALIVYDAERKVYIGIERDGRPLGATVTLDEARDGGSVLAGTIRKTLAALAA